MSSSKETANRGGQASAALMRPPLTAGVRARFTDFDAACQAQAAEMRAISGANYAPCVTQRA